MKLKIKLKSCNYKYPLAADFYVVLPTPEGSESNADTLSALQTVSKTSEYAIDAFRTEYKTILCESTEN